MGESTKLDPQAEQQLCDIIMLRCHAEGFSLTDGARLPLGEFDPKEKSLLEGLKAKLDPYIDFDSGGLKLYEFNYKGSKATFSVVPYMDPVRHRPTGVMLEFRMRF